MKSQVEKIANKPFLRNVAVMATGTAMAQIIYMALSPIITRMYGPEAYGLMGAFMAIVAIIGPVAALTYPFAIVLPKKNKEAHGLMQISFMISIGSAAALAMLLLFFSDFIVNWFNLKHLSSFLFLLPFIALFSGMLQIAEGWLIRTKQFKVTARVTVIQALIVQGSIVLIGIYYPEATVLIIITALAIGFKAVMMISLSQIPFLKQTTIGWKNLTELKELATKHKDFPAFRAPEVFLDAITLGVPILLLANFFGPASAGFYSIGYTVLSVPAQLIGKSVGDVFYPRISDAKNNGENMTKLIKQATFYLGLAGIVPYLVIIVFGPWLFSFVFGENWWTAGEYARWMALWMFFRFLNSASLTALPALSAQAFLLCSTVIFLIAKISAFLIGLYVFSSALAAIIIAAIAEAVLEIIFLYMTLYFSKKQDQIS
ncbi:Membrane protein involved in the export of O-antigen and teichoic acid [Planococcus glaciei]|uniref:lipopolysaccharide biosynthesis protein n=1 Tax=Planococcus glaciei TaxID=459472 RepID=UPI00088CFC8F|nr:oligosaccharide flippase family protein [Planococcus glaciei]SDI33916.1 Membrane protein involved in the export of O-antigen and teichoic acid [Planococcus glaciei]